MKIENEIEEKELQNITNVELLKKVKKNYRKEQKRDDEIKITFQ